PELPRPVDDPHAAVAADAQDLVAGYLRVLPILAGRQVGGHGPGPARPLPRGVGAPTWRRQLISGACLVHGLPQSDGSKTIPHLYSHPSAVLPAKMGRTPLGWPGERS